MLYIHGNLVEYCHDRYADQHKKHFVLSNIAVILWLMSIAFYKSCIHCLPERKEPYKKHLQQKNVLSQMQIQIQYNPNVYLLKEFSAGLRMNLIAKSVPAIRTMEMGRAIYQLGIKPAMM